MRGDRSRSPGGRKEGVEGLGYTNQGQRGEAMQMGCRGVALRVVKVFGVQIRATMVHSTNPRAWPLAHVPNPSHTQTVGWDAHTATHPHRFSVRRSVPPARPDGPWPYPSNK